MEQHAQRDDDRPGDEAGAGAGGTGEAICPECSGTGLVDGEECAYCRGTGTIIQGTGAA